MDTESKNSAQETVQDVDFIQENVQGKVSKPLVSTLFDRHLIPDLTIDASSGSSSS